VVLTLPLLCGVDGVEKMSKSLGNAVALRDPPEEFYGRVMSIPDTALEAWIRLLAPADSRGLSIALDQIQSGGANPRDAKAELAKRLVARYHGAPAAERAAEHFDRVFRRHEPPRDMERIRVPSRSAKGADILTILTAAGFATSRGEGRRLVLQGGVRVGDERIEDPDRVLAPGEHVLQVGKRRFALVAVGGD
jgi:tyrosyl-tRNA synthetase